MRQVRHPHAAMAGFVNNYFLYIKPMLDEGDLEAANGVINDAIKRRNLALIRARITAPKEGSLYSYDFAVNLLDSLKESCVKDTEKISKKLPDINRRVYELELILQGDPIYEEFRQRKKGA